MCRVPCSKDAAAADALELVTALFGDVDLDNDGRICFTEFQAFCKKAQRTIRRRGIAGIRATPVPPQFLKDRAMERLFAVGPSRCSPPSHPPHCEPLFLELTGIT